MSTTIPSASRSARRNVASTTKVAPCRRWAGPKTSPRKLWATIMWSRTVTLNTKSLPVGRRVVGNRVVGNHVAQGRKATCGEPGQHVREGIERRLAGDERV